MAKGGRLYLMQAVRAKLLEQAANQMAELFSKPDRPKNNGEIFRVERIRPLSDASAAVIVQKAPSKKLAVVYFYWLELGKGGEWRYFFVGYGHLVGLEKVKEILDQVEQYNFPKNK